MKKIFIISLINLIFIVNATAQSGQPWNGKKCAVVLTYDDAINEHLDNAIPILDSLGLKATFYVTAFSQSMQSRLNDWKKLATKGYEYKNLFHKLVTK